jgi:hypothetical protein
LLIKIVLDVADIHSLREEEEKSKSQETKCNSRDTKVPSPIEILGDVPSQNSSKCRPRGEGQVPDPDAGTTLVNEKDISS